MSLYSFFAQQQYEEKLKNKDKLVRIHGMVDWEKFRPLFKDVYKNHTPAGGRPNHDVVVMLKVMLLQHINGISDEVMEAELYDRISFRNFIGFDTPIPDARSIWVFRERLSENKLYEKIWKELIEQLEKDSFFENSAMIQDSTTISSCQGKKRSNLERMAEKNHEKITYTRRQQAHIDTYSSWTCKNNQYSYGIKYHLLVDMVSKGILDFHVTTASVHDSQIMLANEGDYSLFLDKGYAGCKDLPGGVSVYIPSKHYKNREHSPEEKELNRLICGIRSRVEHVHAFIKNVIHGDSNSYIQEKRMSTACMFKCMAYNLFRYEYQTRKKKSSVA